MLLRVFGRQTIIGKMRYYFLDRNYTLTTQLLLIGLCLLMTLTSAMLLRDFAITGNPLMGMIPVIAMAALAGFVLLYDNLRLMPMVVLAFTLLISEGISTGTGTKLTFTFLLLNAWAAIWLLRMIVVERRLEVRPALPNRLALAFMLAVVLAFLWSAVYVDEAVSYLYHGKIFPRLMTLMVLLISPVTYFLYANFVRTEKNLKQFVWFFIIVGAVLVGFRLGLGTVPSPMNMGGQLPTWVGVLALGQALFNHNLKWYVRPFLLAVLGAWFYVTIGLGIGWLSGWLPLAFVTGLLVFMFSRRLALLGVLLLAVIMVINISFIQETLGAEGEESGGTREAAWGEALKLTGGHFLFGTGPAGYAFYYGTYGFKANFSHNNYVDIVTQTGIVGFTAFVGFWLSIAWLSWRNLRMTPKGGFRHALSMSLFAANLSTLITMMLGDWVTPFTYTQTLQGIDYTIWSWMLAGITVSSYCLNQSSSEEVIPQEQVNG